MSEIKLTPEQESAEREAIILARGLTYRGRSSSDEKKCYENLRVSLKREGLTNLLKQEQIPFKIVHIDLPAFCWDQFCGLLGTGQDPYEFALGKLSQTGKVPKYVQPKRKNGEVLATFNWKGESLAYDLQLLLEDMQDSELDKSTIRLKALANQCVIDSNHSPGYRSFLRLQFFSSLFGLGSPAQIAENFILREGYDVSISKGGKVTNWNKIPENPLEDKNLSVCFAVAPNSFGYSKQESRLNLSPVKVPRFFFFDEIYSTKEIPLGRRKCTATFYLDGGAHFPDPIKARDVLRKISSADCLEFEFR